MRDLQFSADAYQQYQELRKQGDKKVLDKINNLLNDILRDPFNGLGKPEPLKGNYSGYWSRRVNSEHRLIYKVTKEVIYVFSMKGHYV